MSKPIVEKLDRDYLDRLRKKLHEVVIDKFDKRRTNIVKVLRKEKQGPLAKVNKLRLGYHDAARRYRNARRELEVDCRKDKLFLVERTTKKGRPQLIISDNDPYEYGSSNCDHLRKQVNDLVFEFETAVRGGKDFNDAMAELKAAAAK